MATLPVTPLEYPHSHHHHRVRRLCPHCGSREVHRSRARGIIERHIVRAFRFYPHRCESCDRRFYAYLSTNELS
jgi:predicted RNA-binding Zn-ribbon protein involved in translation (DUF1610 family)